MMPEIVKAVEELGFERPMPVQEQVIPLLLRQNTDIVALAQTGTGKTAAFGLPIVQKIDTSSRHTQALILSPTRELCLQIATDIASYAKYLDDVKVVAVYGGTPIEAQIRSIKQGVHIIVATPGRLVDLLDRKVAQLANVSSVVLDEADEMLNMGFSESLNAILAHLPKERNTLLFSATMPPEIAAISRNYMNKPIEVTVGAKNMAAGTVTHICYPVHAKDKYLVLKRIADYYPNIYGIVFCRTRRETQEIADKLIQDGYNAESLHGDLSQGQRDIVMQKFRNKTIQLLVATDVAARGIDVNDLSHVIHYNLPDDAAVYTHRSGRTGRAGKTGISIAIINLKEKHLVRQIEKNIGQPFSIAKVPNGKEVCEKQLFYLVEKMESVEVEHADIDPFLPKIFEKLDYLSKEEIIKRFVSVEFNRFLQYYRDASDLNLQEHTPSRGERGERNDRGGDRTERMNAADHEVAKGYTRLYINVGRIDGVHATVLLDWVRNQVKGVKVQVGKIIIFKKHTLFEVESRHANTVVTAFSGYFLEDRKIDIRIDRDSGNNNDTQQRQYYSGSGNNNNYGNDRSRGQRESSWEQRNKKVSR